jgi:hypothetical protein
MELHFFGGLTVEETAEILQVSADTIQRDWRFAKTWLRRELTRAFTAPIPAKFGRRLRRLFARTARRWWKLWSIRTRHR